MSSSTLPCIHPHMLLSCACSDGPIAVEVFVRPTKHAPETSESDLLQNFSCGSVKVEFVEPVLCSVSILGESLVCVCVCVRACVCVCDVCTCVQYIRTLHSHPICSFQDLFIHLWKSPSSAAITLSGIVLMGQTLQSVSLSDTSRSQDSGDLG